MFKIYFNQIQKKNIKNISKLIIEDLNEKIKMTITIKLS